MMFCKKFLVCLPWKRTDFYLRLLLLKPVKLVFSQINMLQFMCRECFSKTFCGLKATELGFV